MKIEIRHSHAPKARGQEEVLQVRCGDISEKHVFQSHAEVAAYRKGARDAERMLEQEHAAELEKLRAAIAQTLERTSSGAGLSATTANLVATIASTVRGLEIDRLLETQSVRESHEDVPSQGT